MIAFKGIVQEVTGSTPNEETPNVTASLALKALGDRVAEIIDGECSGTPLRALAVALDSSVERLRNLATMARRISVEAIRRYSVFPPEMWVELALIKDDGRRSAVLGWLLAERPTFEALQRRARKENGEE